MAHNSTSIYFVDGAIKKVTIHNPTRINVQDCRHKEPGTTEFIGLNIHDGQTSLEAYLPPRLAVELHQALDGMLTDADILAAKVT